MIMTEKLADLLLEALIGVAISANGGVPKNGLSNVQHALVLTYAKDKFSQIMNEWEELMGEKWKIEE